MLNTAKRKGYLLSMILVILLHSQVIAQGSKITGTILDDKGKPVALANVHALKLPDSSLTVSGLSDENGQISMILPPGGRYVIKLTAIGYTTGFSKEVDGNDNPIELGKMGMTPAARTLQEVSVSSLRPSIVQLPDRMVVNIAGTAMAAGNTAYDVLGRSPGVFIDHEGNIQLNGRGGVMVMIDGKQTFLSARDLRTMLEGMSAENIKSIELITNPSSKYEAEGLSGIININLKKNTQRGINGSVYAGINYNGTDWGHSFGGNINHKAGKWNTSLSIDRLRRVGGREATFTRIFLNPGVTTYFDQTAVGNFWVQGPPNFRLSTDYSINSRHSVGGMVYYNTLSSYQDFLTQTWIGNSPKNPEVYIDADNLATNKFKNLTTNFRYAWKLDTIGSLFTTDLDYIRITNRGQANFYSFFDSVDNSNDRNESLYTNTPNGFNIYSGRMDVIKMLPKGRKFETGVRFSKVDSDNDFRFYFNNAGLVLDPLRTNHFVYDEKIYAGYVNYVTDLGKKLTVQGGLRVEHTSSVGNLLTTGQITKRNYTDLFPSVFIQHKVSENYNVTWSYGRRINRPNYGNLNPFRSYRDPYTYTEGNPYLRPQYSHSFSITQTMKKVYVLTLSYQLNKDFMAELPKLDVANATTIYYTGNVDGAYSLGATAIAPLNITKKWTSQNTMVLSYYYNEIKVDEQLLVNDQLYFSLQSAHTIMLPKDIRMEVSALFQGPGAYGLYEIKPRSRVDMGLRRLFFKKKVDVTINVVDLFKGQRLKFNTRINGNVNDFDQYLRARFVGLTLRYNFSKGQKVEAKRRNNVEEVNRTGN